MRLVANIVMAMPWTSIGVLGPRKCSQRIGLHVMSGCDTGRTPSKRERLVDTQAPGHRYIYICVLGTSWHYPLSAQCDDIQLLLTLQRTEELYDKE